MKICVLFTILANYQPTRDKQKFHHIWWSKKKIKKILLIRMLVNKLEFNKDYL